MTLASSKALLALLVTTMVGTGIFGKAYAIGPAPQFGDPVLASNPGQITLGWTAPGDDGNIGTANHYVIKYSSSLISESNWASATTLPNPPTSLPAGSHQSFTATGLPTGTPFYFAIKTYDEANNISALSNVPRIFTGGIIIPSPRLASVDTALGSVVLSADTVPAAKRVIYQFALDTISSFAAQRTTIDSMVGSCATVSFQNLLRNDTYYWRLRAIFQDRTDTSAWSNTNTFILPGAVNDTPSVAVISPNGGEHWGIGYHYHITWTATDNTGVTSYAIDYSTNSGSNWIAVQAQTSGNPGTYPWTAPSTPSASCLVRVRAWDAASNVGKDLSNAAFSIIAAPDTIAPTVHVTAPNGGENWRTATIHNITWTGSDNIAVLSYKLKYSTNAGSSWNIIQDWTAGNPLACAWLIPSASSKFCRIQVSLRDSAGNIGSDISDQNFTLRSKGQTALAISDSNSPDVSGYQLPLRSPQTALIPGDYFLSQSYPNPFNAQTNIEYGLPVASPVRIEIYDVLGREVETLVNETQEAGYHHIIWNAGNKPTGVYFYRINASQFAETRKMLLVK